MSVPRGWAFLASCLGTFLGIALAVFIFLSLLPGRGQALIPAPPEVAPAMEPAPAAPSQEGGIADALRELVNFIEETDRREKEKMEWVSDIAHDIKAPLGVIRGCAEILEHRAQGEAQQDDAAFIEAIISLVDEMHGMVDGLAEVGRARSEVPPGNREGEVFSLKELVVDLLQPYMRQCRTRGCSFELALPDDLCLVREDIHAVTQSLQKEVTALVEKGGPGDRYWVQLGRVGAEFVLRISLGSTQTGYVIVRKFSV